jgi:hypothetical protein
MSSEDPDKSPLERAFELAESGECTTTADIQQRLKDEGYNNVDAVLGPWVLRELRKTIEVTGPARARS